MLSLEVFLEVAAVVSVLGAVLLAVRHHRRIGGTPEARQHRTEQLAHVVRLATEIRDISLTIESDLAPFRSLPVLVDLQSRSRRVRLRVEAVLQAQDWLRDLPAFELEAQVAAMHTDHLRMVDLRALADREISDWRKHVRRPDRKLRSTWPFVSTLTTSTPLNTSTLDL